MSAEKAMVCTEGNYVCRAAFIGRLRRKSTKAKSSKTSTQRNSVTMIDMSQMASHSGAPLLVQASTKYFILQDNFAFSASEMGLKFAQGGPKFAIVWHKNSELSS